MRKSYREDKILLYNFALNSAGRDANKNNRRLRTIESRFIILCSLSKNDAVKLGVALCRCGASRSQEHFNGKEV